MKYLTLLLLTWSLSQAPDPMADCAVLLESIAGTYEGGCKRGLAHGKGKAVGTDTYEGEFRKGFPDGEGTYTYANGDTYVGNFEKGVMEGAGKKTFAAMPDMIQEGNFFDGEFIGDAKKPYITINKTVSVSRITYRRLEKEGSYVTFKYTRQGKPVKGRGFELRGSFGVLENATDFEHYVSVHEFPFKGGINFAALVNRSTSGNIGTGEWMDGNIEFEIILPGKWEIEIEMAGMD